MKHFLRFALVATTLCFVQCTREEAEPAIDFDQESVVLMDKLTPQIVGDWSLRRVSIKRQSYNVGQAEIGIKRDTVLQELATLSIRQAAVPRSNPKDLRYPDFDCTIYYKSKAYPMSFSLLANPTRIVQGVGPQAFFLLQYSFPGESHVPESEEKFLESLGLVDNFSVETTADPNTMTWRGLNQGIEKIELQKR